MTRLTDEQRRQNRIDRKARDYKALRLYKCVKDTAVKYQEMIRVEAAVKLMRQDRQGRCLAQCVSCRKLKPYKTSPPQMDAGHWIGRKAWATIFHEGTEDVPASNCHAECKRCNRFDDDGSAKVNYSTFMREVYGQDAMDKLIRLGKTDRTFTREELAELRVGFMDRIKAAERRLNG